MQALRLNINLNGQSPEKGMSFSSPIFVFLFFRHKIENKEPDAQEGPKNNQKTDYNNHEPLYSNCCCPPPPDKEAREGGQDNGGEGC